MKKSIIKVVAFILVFLMLFGIYHKIFVFKTADGPYQMIGFYEEEKNTIDVITMGSSHMFTNCNTSVLWEEYGMAAYNLCGSTQPYWNAYHYLVEAYKTQSPKVVVWDVYTAITYRDLDYSIYENVIKNTYGMKLSRNKIEAINDSVKEGDRLIYYLEYPTYHKRYTDLSSSDFYYLSNAYDKGMSCWRGNRPYFSDPVEFIRPSDELLNDETVGEISEKNEEYLRKIIALCNEHGTKLILTVNPYTVRDGEMPILNRVKEIANETGTDFINFNLCYDEIGFDFNSDYCDDCHMYYTGGEKFTKYLGKCLKERADIPDRRGQAGYESYDKMVASYRETVMLETMAKEEQ